MKPERNNTAIGAFALFNNTIGDSNTAGGWRALFSNTTGTRNTASGFQALFSNTGGSNTATGYDALLTNTTGASNTADGLNALNSNTTGYENTGIGAVALGSNTTGHDNTALGVTAGFGVTTANNVIAIGTAGANVDNNCYIGNISGAGAIGGDPVFITSAGKLGTMSIPSAIRFKEEIRPMAGASEVLFALKPVTFRYKQEFDPERTSQFGLVAEEVDKVDSNLVKRDRDGKLQTVRYEAVNAMLLNEFLKEHRKVQELEATVEKQQKDFQATAIHQQKQIDALTAGLQKVSAELEAIKPVPQVVNNP